MFEDDVATFLTRQTMVGGIVQSPHHRHRFLPRASVRSYIFFFFFLKGGGRYLSFAAVNKSK